MDHRRGMQFDAMATSWGARSASEGFWLASLASASGFLAVALLLFATVATAEDKPDEWRILRADSDAKVSALAMNDDGKLLAVGGDHGEIAILNSSDGKILRLFQAADDHRINAVAFLADDRIAVGDDDGQIKIWRLNEKPEIEATASHQRWVTSLAASPDRKFIASSGPNRTVRLWELSVKTPDFVELAQETSVKHLAYSSDGNRLIASGDRSAVIWDTITRQPVQRLRSNGIVRAGRFTPDGGTAITASEDGSVRIFDTKSGERKRSLTGHAGMVWCLDISPDGKTVATGGFDQTIRLWDIESGQRKQILRGPTTPVIAVQWSRDGTHLIVASEEQILRRYTIEKEAAP